MANVTSTSGLCCLALSLVLKNIVSFPSSPAYTASLDSYFSLQETNVQPQCIVSPQSAQDVSAAIHVLTTSRSGCQFGIRSGGHASFAGAANMQGGVTIDLSALDSIVIGQGVAPVVSIGVGATWGEVYSHLDTLNLTVNGGRDTGVGVGGLTLGGGISFFGPQFGWTCDTVQNFEVVLADGSIVNANKNENPDLLWALRGGTNNFGVITRVDFQGYEQGKLWGGEVILPLSVVDEEINAIAAFNNPATYDEYSSLISSFAYSGAANISVIVNNMEYTKPIVNPPAFQTLLSLPSFTTTERITNLTDLVIEAESTIPNGFRQATATVTIQSTVEAINATVRAWSASLPSVQQIPGIVWSISMDMLPPNIYAKQAEFNALGLTNRHNKTLIVVEVNASWSTIEDDGTVDAATRALIKTIQRDVGKLGALDPFIYINYAASWQKPFAGYGQSNTDKLLKIQRKYDPRRVFTDQVPGGFKLS